MQVIEGNFVILPSDTVYGLFCIAFDKKAVKKIYAIKGREYNKPLQVFFPGVKVAEKYVVLDAGRKKLLKKYLPGPYTVILKLKPAYKSKFTFLKQGTIGVRVIRSKLIDALILKTGPLAATSANISGEKTPVKFKDISYELRSKAGISVINDPAVRGRASRVVDLTGERPVILRK